MIGSATRWLSRVRRRLLVPSVTPTRLVPPGCLRSERLTARSEVLANWLVPGDGLSPEALLVSRDDHYPDLDLCSALGGTRTLNLLIRSPFSVMRSR